MILQAKVPSMENTKPPGKLDTQEPAKPQFSSPEELASMLWQESRTNLKTGKLSGEPSPSRLNAFPGAYYYKIASSLWNWSGIEGTITLGQPQTDAKRRGKHGNALDGFSIYMGGRSGRREIDAGLSWNYVRDENGDVDKSQKAWRPFFRNAEWHWIGHGQTYWKPGETVSMVLTIAGPNKLRITISDEGPNPKRAVSAIFPASGFSFDRSVQFKRVNAIDQKGREGKSVVPTNASVEDSIWLDTNLIFRSKGRRMYAPMDAARRSIVESPGGHTDRTIHKEGSGTHEEIDIFGNRKDIP